MKWAHSFLAVALAAGFFFAGTWYNQRATVKGGVHEGRRVLYYQDPMHPAYKSDRPGIAPDCGMQLEPVYAPSDAPQSRGPQSTQPSGAVQIDVEMQRSIGLRTEEVTRAARDHNFRVLGRVALDETRIYRVAAAVDGWIRKAGPIVTGSIVQKDELLATFYNRDFLTAQQTYLYALNTMDRFKDNESEDQLKLTRAQCGHPRRTWNFWAWARPRFSKSRAPARSPGILSSDRRSLVWWWLAMHSQGCDSIGARNCSASRILVTFGSSRIFSKMTHGCCGRSGRPLSVTRTGFLRCI
jgi:hypothetical protein